MSSYRTEAVVIKSSDFGEADRLLTLYTRNKGKLSAIAKGVKKPESRKAGSVDLLSHVSLYLAEGRSLDIILEASLLNTFSNLRQNLHLIASCYAILELVDQITPDRQENIELFRLLTQVLTKLDEVVKDEDAGKILTAFKIKLLTNTGFRPQLVKCANCSSILTTTSNRFSAALGGVLCGACGNLDKASRPISSQAIKILRFIQDEDYDQVMKLDYPKVLGMEVEQQIRYYLEYLLEKELKSNHFVEKVNGLSS